MDVRDFFELERALEGDGIVDAAAEIQKIAALLEPRRKLANLIARLERLLDRDRQPLELLNQRPRDVDRQRASRLPEMNGEQMQRDELRRERFCRGDADLRTCMRVHSRIRFACGHAADDVADRDAARAALFRFAQRTERVGRLA